MNNFEDDVQLVVTWDLPLPYEQTDWKTQKTENITFPYLRWRAVKIPAAEHEDRLNQQVLHPSL